MGYGKSVTELIVHCWGKGLTAEETQKYIIQKENKKIGIATIYRHRHSLTAKEIIEELMREQRRDIALCQSDGVRMKYRDKLLEKLLPHTELQFNQLNIDQSKNLDVIKFEQLDNQAIQSIVRNILRQEERRTHPSSLETT